MTQVVAAKQFTKIQAVPSDRYAICYTGPKLVETYPTIGDIMMPKRVRNARLNQIDKMLRKYEVLLEIVNDQDQKMQIKESYSKYLRLREQTLIA